MQADLTGAGPRLTNSQTIGAQLRLARPVKRGIAVWERQRGPVRTCGITVRPRSRGPARSHVPYRFAVVPVHHRALGRRQELALAPAVPVAAAHAWTGYAVRPRCRHPEQGRAGKHAAAYRDSISGFPTARPYDDIRERRIAVASDRAITRNVSRGGRRTLELGRPRRSYFRIAAGALGRRETARSDRAGGDRATTASARRRADGQRRSQSGEAAVALVHRAQ